MWFPGSNNDDDKESNLDALFPLDLEKSKRDFNELSNWVDSATRSIWSTFGRPNLEMLNHSISDLTRFISKDPEAVVALPVPSVQQYSSCLDKGGRSIWTEDGFWRCILKGNSVPSHLKEQFPDYTSFLQYQHKLLKLRQEEEAKRFNEVEKSGTSSSGGWGNSWTSFPGSERPRLITEDEARGKRVVSQSKQSQTVTLENGDLETRTQLVQQFDDGTALVKSSTDSKPPSAGWFWK